MLSSNSTKTLNVNHEAYSSHLLQPSCKLGQLYQKCNKTFNMFPHGPLPLVVTVACFSSIIRCIFKNTPFKSMRLKFSVRLKLKVQYVCISRVKVLPSAGTQAETTSIGIIPLMYGNKLSIKYYWVELKYWLRQR